MSEAPTLEKPYVLQNEQKVQGFLWENAAFCAEARLTKTQRLSADANHPPQLPRGAGEQQVSRESAEERLKACLFFTRHCLTLG